VRSHGRVKNVRSHTDMLKVCPVTPTFEKCAWSHWHVKMCTVTPTCESEALIVSRLKMQLDSQGFDS